MMYTVKQLATLAGVSPRTLHYYDEIGLLKPSAYGENGYRYYEAEALLVLQQILFFRELDFSLTDIRAILERPNFDLTHALHGHKQALQQKVRRLNDLIHTIDQTIHHIEGEIPMKPRELFAHFDEATQQQHEQTAMQLYDPVIVRASNQRWQKYTADQKAQIKAEGEAIYRDLVVYMAEGVESEVVQAIIGRWHQHIRYFYEPTPEMMAGLGRMYTEDPAFATVYEQLHPNLPTFLREAIEHYCVALVMA